jgi:serine/threonine protein kinase
VGACEAQVGSLKEQLPHLLWFQRLRIATEVAQAVLFLHQQWPKPVVHRDLKPSNVLLDRQLSAKVGDVGLACLMSTPDIQNPSRSYTTQFAEEVADRAGTSGYIDPEYLASGNVGPSSDVYSLGVMLLQLLCGHRRATPALVVGWVNDVEAALLTDSLPALVDPRAGCWPPDNATAFAVCALSCVEPRRMRRANLRRHVLPELTRLLADTADTLARGEEPPPQPRLTTHSANSTLSTAEEMARHRTTDTVAALGGYVDSVHQ